MNKLVWIITFVTGLFLLPGGLGAGIPTKQILKRLLALRGKHAECDKLSEILLQIRDDMVTIGGWNLEIGEDALKSIEMVLNFPIEADGHWKSLACDIAGVKTMDDLLGVLNGFSLPFPVVSPFVSSMLITLKEASSQLSMLKPMYAQFFTKASRWMRKSGYPDVWPLTDTTEAEVTALLNEAVLSQVPDIFLFGMDVMELYESEGYAGVPKALIEAQSIDEYLTSIGQDHLLDDPASFQQEYLTPLDIVKDSAKLEVLLGSGDHTMDFLDELRELGILDLAGDTNYNYNYY